jgi:hypothetical protein
MHAVAMLEKSGSPAQRAPKLSGLERAYLCRRLDALEAAGAALHERAGQVAEPEASLLLNRAQKRRARAARIRQYLRTAQDLSMPGP